MSDPITGLSDGAFLLFYATVCTATLAACRWYVRSHDATRSMLPPPIPLTVDPYEIAYMRGGENELTRVVIVSLTERGYLRTTEQGIERTEAPPARLVGAEETTYEWLSIHRTPEEVFASDLPQRVRAHCLGYDERLQEERLVADEAAKAFGWKAAVSGGLVILGIGGWRLLNGLVREQPVGFLVFMGLAGLGILIGLCSSRGQLTARGRAYADRLKGTLDSLRASTGGRYALAAAVLGMGSLAGTPYAKLGDLFRKAGSSGSGGCGADGCGDGCGGCGGCN